jgi:hypothetical protein
MQQIVIGTAAAQNISTAKAVLTVYAPPCGSALYRLEIKFTGLDAGHQLQFTEGTSKSEVFERAATATTILREFTLTRGEGSVAVTVIDLAGLSTACAWSYKLCRLNEIDVIQPSQIIANGSTNAILFRMSGTSGTPTVELSKNGAAFAAAAGVVSSVSSGLAGPWWKLTPTAADTNTNGPLVVAATREVVGQTAYVETQYATHFIFGDATDAIATAVDAVLQDDFDAINEGIGAGAGGIEWPITINDDNGDPLSGVDVWLTTDEGGEEIARGSLVTDDDGVARFLVDVDVTYYVWAKIAGKQAIQGETFTAT